MSLVFTIVGKFIAALAMGLSYVINIPVYPEGGIAVINETWKIMRNFSNMFFIVILIVMAFATIFNITKYDARTLFPKFLIAAILINFSLVIGGLIIDGSQILSNTFLVSIGDMSNRLGESLNPTNLLPVTSSQLATLTGSSPGVGQTALKAGIQLVFSVILAFTFLFSLLTAFIFTFIRIPILWALLIVSPLAWILSILPAMQKTYKKWWSLFIGWNLFLPIFLFFLYFSLYFLQNQGDVMNKIAAQTKNQGIAGFITFQTLFYYVLASIFLIGGTITAMKASLFSGTGVVGVAKWSRGVVARRIGLTAMGGAAKQRLEQTQKEGFPTRFGQKLYGGETGLERQTSRWAERFGVRGADDSQLAKDITANKKKFENITDPAQLASLMSGKGRRDEKLAAAEIMKDRGLLNNAQLQQTYELYGPNTIAGKQFARSIHFDKLSAKDREGWLGRVPDAETMQKILSTMADKGDDYIKKEENIHSALDLFKLEGEQRDFLKKIEKHELLISTKVQMERGFIREGKEDIRKVYTDPQVALEKSLEQIIKKMGPDALLEATKTLTKDPHLGGIALNALNQQKIEAMMAKGTREQLESWKTIAPDKFDEVRIKTEKERIARELAEITGKASGEAIARELNHGGGTSSPARPMPTSPGNIVDLRTGEKRTSGGIILTPGAQFQKEQEERENQ